MRQLLDEFRSFLGAVIAFGRIYIEVEQFDSIPRTQLPRPSAHGLGRSAALKIEEVLARGFPCLALKKGHQVVTIHHVLRQFSLTGLDEGDILALDKCICDYIIKLMDLSCSLITLIQYGSLKNRVYITASIVFVPKTTTIEKYS